MTQDLTLLCVHAHPDDEASSTGGVLRTYATQGVRTVLVTCTDGALGDDPDGTTPDAHGHDPMRVAAHRADELRVSADILGISRLEMLGYPDSGMDGWPQNDAPGSFWSTPIDGPAERLADIFHEERPQVIVTYDENGLYGHPDHIQANRVTRAALERSGLTASLYYTAIPASAFARFRSIMEEAGIEAPGGGEGDDEAPRIGRPDEDIGVVVDVAAAADAKFDALSAHSSQTENSFFLQMGRDRFRQFFGHEWFVRAVDPFDRIGVDDDLFAPWRT
jgi:LmbE family N-acetylglucosaminyl deacetylase